MIAAFGVLLLLVGTRFQATTMASFEYRASNLQQDSDDAETEHAEKMLTSGVWKRIERTETNETHPTPPIRYTFTPDHRVTVVPSEHLDNVTTWSVERYNSDTHLIIDGAIYLLYFKTQEGHTSMRLGQLSNIKSTPSVFEDFVLEPRRHH
jgi:hypothetical protein